MAFILFMPEVLLRPVPTSPVPFSTPRSWALLSKALDLVEERDMLTPEICRALAFGRLSAEDAALFSSLDFSGISPNIMPADCILNPGLLPKEDSGKWLILSLIRKMAARDELTQFTPKQIYHFLKSLPEEHRFALFIDLVPIWGKLGASELMLTSLERLMGVV